MRSNFLFVGFTDLTLRVLSLELDSALEKISVQIQPAAPVSLQLAEINE